MEDGFRTKLRRRRLLQSATAVLLVLASLFVIGICRNIIVLPFLNFSAAVMRSTGNVIPPLSASDKVSAGEKLSFLEVLRYLGAQSTQGAERSLAAYSANSQELVLLEVPAGVMPAARTVEGKAALEVHGGFLVRNNADGTRTLFSAEGQKLLDPMPEDLVFTGHWDSTQSPVLSSAAGYVRWDSGTGALVASDYNPGLSNITGAELPAYYGKPDGEVELRYNGKEYGYYYRESGDICYRFYHTGQSYQFVDGYGALGTSDGILFVNRAATSFFTSFGTFLQPEGEGEELLGYYQFDHRLCRVRLQDHAGQIQEAVITEGNELFSLPGDYRVVSYSDGVFLMEKDGRYGFLDYTGRWIAQPVYTYARAFREGLAVLGDKDGKKGVIDTTGKFVIPMEFEEVSVPSGGIIALCRATEWTLVQKVLTVA